MKIRRMAIGAVLAVVTLIPVAAAVPAQAAPAATPQVAAHRCTFSTHSWVIQPRTSKTHITHACARRVRALFLGQFPAGSHWVYGPWRGTGQTSTAHDGFATHVRIYGRQWQLCSGCTIHTKTWAA